MDGCGLVSSSLTHSDDTTTGEPPRIERSAAALESQESSLAGDAAAAAGDAADRSDVVVLEHRELALHHAKVVQPRRLGAVERGGAVVVDAVVRLHRAVEIVRREDDVEERGVRVDDLR